MKEFVDIDAVHEIALIQNITEVFQSEIRTPIQRVLPWSLLNMLGEQIVCYSPNGIKHAGVYCVQLGIPD